LYIDYILFLLHIYSSNKIYKSYILIINGADTTPQYLYLYSLGL